MTSVTWSTKNPAVATIADNGSRSVIVNGVTAGSQTYVVASYAYSGGVSRDSTLVTVTASVPVTSAESQVRSIRIEPVLPVAAVGQQVQFRVRYFSASGAEINAEPGSTTRFDMDVSSVADIGVSTGLATVRGSGESGVQAAYQFPGRTTLFSTTTLNKTP
ncbi:MAG TPA: hypothetical protein VHM24_00530 [Gemmatimonadaceae bacterium]|nr:hypothetical protein [Gemmatimonadaceae bacterium]